jgi:hypothetical protein
MHDQFDSAIRDARESSKLFEAIPGTETGSINPTSGVERIIQATAARLRAGEQDICVHSTGPQPLWIAFACPETSYCESCWRNVVAPLLLKSTSCDVCGNHSVDFAEVIVPIALWTFSGYLCPQCRDDTEAPVQSPN